MSLRQEILLGLWTVWNYCNLRLQQLPFRLQKHLERCQSFLTTNDCDKVCTDDQEIEKLSHPPPKSVRSLDKFVSKTTLIEKKFLVNKLLDISTQQRHLSIMLGIPHSKSSATHSDPVTNPQIGNQFLTVFCENLQVMPSYCKVSSRKWNFDIKSSRVTKYQ